MYDSFRRNLSTLHNNIKIFVTSFRMRFRRTALHHLSERLHCRLLCALEATFCQQGAHNDLQGTSPGQVVVLRWARGSFTAPHPLWQQHRKITALITAYIPPPRLRKPGQSLSCSNNSDFVTLTSKLFAYYWSSCKSNDVLHLTAPDLDLYSGSIDSLPWHKYGKIFISLKTVDYLWMNWQNRSITKQPHNVKKWFFKIPGSTSTAKFSQFVPGPCPCRPWRLRNIKQVNKTHKRTRVNTWLLWQRSSTESSPFCLFRTFHTK